MHFGETEIKESNPIWSTVFGKRLVFIKIRARPLDCLSLCFAREWYETRPFSQKNSTIHQVSEKK
jgi:hypothetical protein